MASLIDQYLPDQIRKARLKGVPRRTLYDYGAESGYSNGYNRTDEKAFPGNPTYGQTGRNARGGVINPSEGERAAGLKNLLGIGQEESPVPGALKEGGRGLESLLGYAIAGRDPNASAPNAAGSGPVQGGVDGQKMVPYETFDDYGKSMVISVPAKFSEDEKKQFAAELAVERNRGTPSPTDAVNKDSKEVPYPKAEGPEPLKVDENTTLGEIQVDAIRKKQVEQATANKALHAQGEAAIKKAGGSKEELKGWAKFNDDFDLRTVGLALMASSNNNEGLMANLGTALMAGKNAKKTEKADAAAIAAEIRKEERAIYKIKQADIKEKNDVIKDSADAVTARMQANTADLRARMEGMGIDMKPTASSDASAEAAMVQVQKMNKTDIPEELQASVMEAASALTAAQNEYQHKTKQPVTPAANATRAVQKVLEEYNTIQRGLGMMTPDYALPGTE